jgi:hypothetical protein
MLSISRIGLDSTFAQNNFKFCYEKKGRFIYRKIIVGYVDNYQNDKYMQMCLVYSKYQDQELHVLFATD